jgi:EmrB/QacA subfamily drug resistance transporter
VYAPCDQHRKPYIPTQHVTQPTRHLPYEPPAPDTQRLASVQFFCILMSTTVTDSSTAASGQPHLSKVTERNILIAMCTALVAVVASMSGLNVAQQAIAVELGSTQSGVLWIINAYSLALAALLMPIGAIGDKWGRKPVLLTGLSLFALSNIGAILAQSTAQMIAARIVGGVGAAMIMPVTLSVITSSFPEEDRARAVGIWAGFAGSGGMIGLFVSAFTVDVLSWRWAFGLPILLAGLAFIITMTNVPNSREGDAHSFDIVGSVLSALAIGGLVLGIHEGPERGWSHSITIAGLIVGVMSLVLFITWERKVTSPLLDISTFSDRGLASGVATITIVFAVMFGIFLVLFPFLQAVLGWSALRSAIAMLPMAAVMMPTSTMAPRIAGRVGSRTTMLAGVTLFSSGLALLALRASVEGGYLSVLPGLMIVGFGMGLTMTPATTAITETLPPEKQGVASALNDTSREIGGAVGMALLGSVLSAAFRTEITNSLIGLPDQAVDAAGEGIANAFGVAAQLTQSGKADEALRIIDAAKHSFVSAWTSSMWVGVVLSAIAVGVLAVFGPRRAK